MRHVKANKRSAVGEVLPSMIVALALLLTPEARAAAPGITGGAGTTALFNLTAQANFISQPDGNSVYSWGYGCSSAPAGFNPSAALMPNANCPTMQIPGHTDQQPSQGCREHLDIVSGF
jgi:hypothetical protein